MITLRSSLINPEPPTLIQSYLLRRVNLNSRFFKMIFFETDHALSFVALLSPVFIIRELKLLASENVGD